MNAKDKELLYKIYLASLEDNHKHLPEPMNQEIDWAEADSFSFEQAENEDGGTEGQILVILSGSHEILCLISEKCDRGLYRAYKLSSFTGLGSKTDLNFSTASSRYLLERDNCFWLDEEAIDGGYLIDAVGRWLLQKINIALKEKPRLLSASNCDWDRPENRFRIKEHELTLELRSRYLSDTGLWIPQMDSLNREKNQERLPLAAFIQVTPIFDALKNQVDTDVYFTEHYTLQRNECCDLVLIPDDKHIGKTAEIKCGEIAVFRGRLPKEIVMASFIPLKPQQAQQFLDISLILLKD